MTHKTKITCRSKRNWILRRKKSIGASDAACIVLEPGKAFKSRYALWCDKLTPYDSSEIKGLSEQLEWGHRAEPMIAKAFKEETGRKITNPGPYTIQYHPRYDFISCTVDRMQYDQERGEGVLEIKNYSEFGRKQWEDGVPDIYYIQLQHQLAVTGCQWGSLAVLIGGNHFHSVDIDRDDELIDNILQMEIEFWELVKTETPPKFDGEDSSRKSFVRLHPNDNGERVVLPNEADALYQEELELKQQIDLLERERAAKRLQISHMIGTNTYGISPSGAFEYSLKTQGGKEYYVVPSDMHDSLVEHGIHFKQKSSNGTRVLRRRQLNLMQNGVDNEA